jgi:hypothetical protein
MQRLPYRWPFCKVALEKALLPQLSRHFTSVTALPVRRFHTHTYRL